MGLKTVLSLSGALGITSFLVGILPLFFAFSRTRIAQLSTYGTGLLLGAALGVIIPEGAEAIYSSNEFQSPTTTIALTLLCGFTLMLVVEQVISHDHTHGHEGYILAPTTQDDASGGQTSHGRSGRANPITLGLVIHSLADGLALGASFGASAEGDIRDHPLTLIVFFALLIHKAPTSLALSSALLSYLPRPRIRLHIAVFAAATPIGALVAYLLISLFSSSQHGDKWGGIALAFSGGTFLYVSTVLQPVREETPAGEEEGSPMMENTKMGRLIRLFLIVAGMFTPLLMSLAITHKHGHS